MMILLMIIMMMLLNNFGSAVDAHSHFYSTCVGTTSMEQHPPLLEHKQWITIGLGICFVCLLAFRMVRKHFVVPKDKTCWQLFQEVTQIALHYQHVFFWKHIPPAAKEQVRMQIHDNLSHRLSMISTAACVVFIPLLFFRVGVGQFIRWNDECNDGGIFVSFQSPANTCNLSTRSCNGVHDTGLKPMAFH